MVGYLCEFSEVTKVSGSTVGAAVKKEIYLFNVHKVSYCVDVGLVKTNNDIQIFALSHLEEIEPEWS